MKQTYRTKHLWLIIWNKSLGIRDDQRQMKVQKERSTVLSS
jgi:hypothetical protein